jgi:hypothetical protein
LNRSCSLPLVLVLAFFQTATSAPIDELIANAKKEGVIELYAPSTLVVLDRKEIG